MLNENNVQASLNYNGTTGKPTLVGITGSFKLELSKRVVWQDSSESIAVDLGYSIDGKFEDWIFKIDNKILKIRVVTFRNNIADKPIPDNEVVIVSNDPNFRSTVFLSRKNIDKLFYYEITTVNSTLSAWMMDEIAFKLNRFDPVQNTADITDLKSRMQLAENDLDVLDVDLRELENKVNSLDERLTDTESKISIAEANITTLNSSVDTLLSDVIALKDKTAGIESTGGTTFITNPLKASSTFEVAGNSLLQDLEVRGNVSGTLKDAEGFKYEKVKRGTLKNPPAIYSDVEVLVYPENRCFIKGILTEVSNIEVPAGDLSTSILTQIVTKIDSIKSFILTDITGEAKFIASVNGNIEPPFLNLVYRNITNTNQKILATKLYFTIDCIKNDMSDTNFLNN